MLIAPLAYDSKYGYSTENFLQLLFIIGPITDRSRSLRPSVRMSSMKAMILAAGYGERLWPLTADRTKPALPVLGKPLVGYAAEYLAGFGITRGGGESASSS